MRHLLTPSALKTQRLYKADDDDDFYDDYGPEPLPPPAPLVFQADRSPSFTPIGLLDAHGSPLGRYVIPIIRPIGFGAIHPDDDGADSIVYICSEADLRVEQTDAGRSDEPQFNDPELEE